jgi:hypothetical protein
MTADLVCLCLKERRRRAHLDLRSDGSYRQRGVDIVCLPLGNHDVVDYRGAKTLLAHRQLESAERQLREIEFAVLIAGGGPLLAGRGV